MSGHKTVTYEDLMVISNRIKERDKKKLQELPLVPLSGPHAVASFLRENFPYISSFNINETDYAPYPSHGTVNVETVSLCLENDTLLAVVDTLEADVIESNEEHHDLIDPYDLTDAITDFMNTHDYICHKNWINVWFDVRQVLESNDTDESKEGKPAMNDNVIALEEDKPVEPYGREKELIQGYLASKNHHIETLEFETTVASLALYALYLKEHFPNITAFKINEDNSLYPFVKNPIEISFYNSDGCMGSFKLYDPETLVTEDAYLESLYQGSDEFFSSEFQKQLSNLASWNNEKLTVGSLVQRWNPQSLRNQ